MRKVAAVIVVVVLAGLVWTGGWVYVAGEAGRRTDAWIASEAQAGRVWTCPDRRIGGYPLAIAVHCTDPTYAGEALGQAVQASLGHLVAEASLLHPTRVALALGPPFAYQTSDHQTDVTGTWTHLAVDIDGLPDPRVFTLDGSTVRVDGLFGQAGRQAGEAATMTARFALVAGPADPSVDFHLAVDGTPVPALDALAGGTAPLDLDLTGRLTHAAIGDARTPEDAMERWRLAGGRIDLGPSQATRGPSEMFATGTIGLDQDHRPRGRLAAQFVGLEPILRRFGISTNLAAAGSLLSALFGGGPRPDAPVRPGALVLPVGISNGQLSIGPIRTSVVVPALY